MEKGNFIKIEHSFLGWEWYQDINTKCLFLHCLLKASPNDTSYRGHEIKRGTFITSIRMLASETGLTVQQTKTALEHLQKTHEITIKATHNQTTVIVDKYEVYMRFSNAEQYTEQHTDNPQNSTQITHGATQEPTNEATQQVTHKTTNKRHAECVDFQGLTECRTQANNTQSNTVINTASDKQLEKCPKQAEGEQEEKEKYPKEKEEYTQHILYNNTTYKLKENNNNIIIPPFFDAVWKDIISRYPRRKGLEEECKVKYYEMLEAYEDKEEIVEDTQAVITDYVERYDREHPDDTKREYIYGFKRFFDEKFTEELQSYRNQKNVFTGFRESDKVLEEAELSEVCECKFDHSGLAQYHEVLKEIYRIYPVHRYMHTAYESLYFSIVNNYEDATGANLLYASVGKYLEEMKNRKQYYIPELGYWLKYEAVKVMETITEFKKLIS